MFLGQQIIIIASLLIFEHIK